MNDRIQRVSPFLSFATEAEEAARFYTGIFPNSRITTVTRYGKDLAKLSGQEEGSVLTVAFELDGQQFTALNGGPAKQFGASMSLVVNCADQQEIDHYWDALSAGGKPIQCGWLVDRYGITWQVVPSVVWKFHAIGGKLADGMMAALVQMTKLDLATLEKAARDNAEHIDVRPAGKRVRVTRDGETIADTTEALAMKEGDYPVVYYVPRKDVKMDRLERSSLETHCPFKGDASYFSFKGGPKDAVWSYERPYERMAAIREHLAFYPDKVDAIETGA